jgi:hypothetical protein
VGAGWGGKIKNKKKFTKILFFYQNQINNFIVSLANHQLWLQNAFTTRPLISM